MTHTLHRLGTAEELSKDFVVFAMGAQNVTRDGCAPKLRRIFAEMLKFNPVNYGDMRTGNKFSAGKDKILQNVQDNSIVHAVFTDADTVTKVLAALKKLDTGMSVVVSGLFETVGQCCHHAGLQRHTTENSLGIWGNTGLLPEREVLEITTMCGHGMVAASLVEKMAQDVKAGRKTADGAAQELARMCHCGILNPVRAAELLTAMAK